MTNNLELRWKIQEALKKQFLLLDEARPIKTRLKDPTNPDHSLSDVEIKTLLAPDKQFEDEVYPLFLEEYGPPADEE